MVPAFSRLVYLFGELLSALSDISDQLLVHFRLLRSKDDGYLYDDLLSIRIPFSTRRKLAPELAPNGLAQGRIGRDKTRRQQG
jgi:hypothetical protein